MKGGMIMVQLNSTGDDKNQKEYFFTGLSTDTKPTKWKGVTFAQMSIFLELDTKKVFLFDLENRVWREF